MNNKYKFLMFEKIDKFYKYTGEISFQLEELRRKISIDTVNKTGKIIEEFINNGMKNIKIPKSYFTKEFFVKILVYNIEIFEDLPNKETFINYVQNL